MPEHLGWYHRKLPHYDSPDTYQGITFRLHDSLPKHVVEALLRYADEDNLSNEIRAKYETYLNASNGVCWLRRPEIAELVQSALQFFHKEHYELIAWVIMPNHVHVLIKTYQGFRLPDILHSWKSYTAKQANKLLERKGPFWAQSYYDRYIRNEKHYYAAIHYIHKNPVKAKLVTEAQNWPYSSAQYYYENDTAWEDGPLVRHS